MSEYILELKDVVKTFGGVKALNGVHFQVTCSHHLNL